MTIKEMSKGLREGHYSALEITKFFINKIKKEKNNFSFITLSEELALEQAKKADLRIARGDKNVLLGIPLALKDNIMVANIRCTAGSKALQNYYSSYDATVVKKLKEEGAIILGKTNLDEFAMGSSTESSFFGETKNPYDPSRVPGGSSGGSAVAVASGLASFALGSDTGGSIRQPAAFCGVVGLKPTYGAVSRFGLIAMASSLDQIGTFTKNVEDAMTVFTFISGQDALDSTSADYLFSRTEVNFSKLRFGLPQEYFIKGMDERIKEKMREVVNSVIKLGGTIKEISLPEINYALPVYYIIMPAEVSSNMSRYDGLRYGFSASEREEMIESYFANRGEGLGIEVKRRIILGTFTLSAGYKEAYYKKASKIRKLIKNDFRKVFKEVDLILGPTCPTLPFKRGEKINDPLAMYLSDIFTVTANLAGLPAMSLPCGQIDSLPVGIQIIGRPFEENKILGVGQVLEKIWNQQ